VDVYAPDCPVVIADLATPWTFIGDTVIAVLFPTKWADPTGTGTRA
jgi:hypothetical protein